VKEKLVKTVLNKKKKRDDWFLDDYTLNPYEGCSMNCQYCYVRGSKYGENMEETLAVKINSLPILEKQLASRALKDQRGIIALASATDPYLKAEETYRLTRAYLELILHYRFPVLIITKSDLVVRDIDLLRKIDQQAIHAPDLQGKLTRGAIVSFSFSTLDPLIASTLEPGAIPPMRRLETLKRCADAGLFTGVNLIPVLPFINDTPEQLEFMIRRCAEMGAKYIIAGGLTLFGNGPADSKTLYHKFLGRRFPEHISEYQRLYGSYFYPPKIYHRRLSDTVRELCEKSNVANGIIAAQQNAERREFL
jgi:DNA repair photolyase